VSYENILVSVESGVGVVTLNRPEVRNALDQGMVDDLHAAFDDLATRSDLRVVILHGAGGKAFMSGADIGQLRERRSPQALMAINARLFQKIEEFPLPTIAAIQGYALGGGCELAMSCDLRVVGKSSKFGQPEVALGIIPAAGGTQRMPRLVGLGKAKELIFTGRIIDADEAHRIGLVNQVVEDDAVMTAAHALADEIARQGTLALRLAKLSVNTSSRTGQDTGFLVEQLAQAVLFDSDDKHTRMTGFLDKQAARKAARAAARAEVEKDA
jgi:enoyl-CoA hydratase